MNVAKKSTDLVDNRFSRRAFLSAGFAVAATSAAAARGPMRRGRSLTGETAGFYRTVNNRAEMDALLSEMRANVAPFSGKNIAVAPGDYGTTMIDATGILAANSIIFMATVWRGVTTPGFNAQDSTNLLFTKIVTYRGTFAGDETGGVNRIDRSGSCGFVDCEVYSNALASADFNLYVGVAGGAGDFLDGEPVATMSTLGGATLATGTYSATQPGSSPTSFAILDSSGGSLLGTEGPKWNGKILYGTVSGAWRQMADPANISANNNNFLVGIYSLGSVSVVSNLTVHDCYIHDVKWPVAGVTPGLSYQRNTLVNCYISFGDFQQDITGAVIKDNRGTGIWAHDRDCAIGTSGPHSSLLGISQRSKNSSDVLIEGNVFVIGSARFLVTGRIASASGPKMNDQGGVCTGSISGNVLTLTAIPGGTISLGAGIFVRWLADLVGLVITSQKSGTTGGLGEYYLSGTASLPAGTLIALSSQCLRWIVRSNLFISNNSLGFEWGYAKDSVFAYNTIASDQENVLSSVPGFFWHDQFTGNTVHHNVWCSSGYLNFYNDPSFFEGAYDNITLDFAATSGLLCYAANFNGRGVGGGNDWKGITAENALAAFQPKLGSRIAIGYGHSAYYNHATRVSSYPTFVKPTTSVSTGVDLAAVVFDGVDDYARLAKGATGIADTPNVGLNAFTIVFNSKILFNNAADATLIQTGGTDLWFRRKPDGSDNRLTVTAKRHSDGASVMNITSSFQLVEGEEAQIVLSVDLAAYKCHFMKNRVLDGLVAVTTWTGDPMRSSSSNITLLAGSTATASTGTKYAANVKQFLFHDAFLDLSVAANHDKVVANDNRPVSLGTDGSSLFGVAPRVYAKGNAAAWTNGGAGINLGSAAATLVVTGALADAA